jgi:nucleotide-binding universal stress UspA family protein
LINKREAERKAKCFMKVLWAIDPFSDKKNKLKQMHGLLKNLAHDSSDIEVGYVATRMENSLNLAFEIPEEERYSSYPRKAIKKSLSDARVVVKDENILVEDSHALSTSKAVENFLSMAKSRRSNLVALHTHAREGISRFILGSFAESMIHQSELSVLVVNPRTKPSSRIRRVLYASDFSSPAKKHLKTVVKIAKGLNSDLIIFHKAFMTYKVEFAEMSAEAQSYRNKVNNMKKWIEGECKKSGISAKVIINSEFDKTSDLILKCKKKHDADLIVVNAQVGSLTSLMGGSVTRQVVRAAQVPVLVLK